MSDSKLKTSKRFLHYCENDTLHVGQGRSQENIERCEKVSAFSALGMCITIIILLIISLFN
jgi:hypothetical protein